MNRHGVPSTRLRSALLAAVLLAAPHAVAANSWTFQLEMTAKYDDNITELSDTDRARVGQAAYADRFRIETPDDFILSPAGRAEWSRSSAADRESSVRITAAVNHYVRNSVKNYEAYGVRFSQDLVPRRRFGTTLILRAGLTPIYYLRELTVPEASRLAGVTVRDSAQYSSTEYSLGLRQVLVPKRLDLTLSVGREPRDYDDPFNERDGDLTGISAELSLRPVASRRLELQGGYRYESYNARGDNAATLALEPDISTDRQTASLSGSFNWGSKKRRGEISLSLERETRDFSSDSPTDVYHFGRKDTRSQAVLNVRQGVGANLWVNIGLSHETNDSTLGPSAPSTPGDDVTDYTHQVASAALSWRF